MTQIARPDHVSGEPAPAREASEGGVAVGAAPEAQVGHWIGGREVPGTSDRSGPVFDPARGVVARTVAFASAADVDAAVAAAVAAFPAWRATSLSRRAEIMF